MSTSESITALRNATVEVLLQVLKDSPIAELESHFATLHHAMIDSLDEVCGKLERFEQVENSATPIVAGRDTEESEMILSKGWERRRTENVSLENENQALREKVKKLETAQASQDFEMTKMRDDESELKGRLDLANKEFQQQATLMNDLSERCSKAEAQIVNNEVAIKEKDALLARAKANGDRLRSMARKPSTVIEGMRKGVEDCMKTSCNEGRQSISKLQNFLENCVYRYLASYIYMIADYQAQLKEKDNLIAKQTEQLAAQQEELDDLIEDNEEKESSIDHLNLEIVIDEQQIADQADQIKELEGRLIVQSDAYHDLYVARREIARLAPAMDRAERELDRLRRLRARGVASSSSRHDQRWAESDDEEDEYYGASEASLAVTIHSLLNDSFARAQRAWGH